MNLPFLSDGTIDLKGFLAQVENAIEVGVVGFMVLLFSSKVNNLGEDEQYLIV